MVPFFIFYSMFGFQRIGDFIWACADMRGRGFLMGGTAGRTTLNGEGLQHGDGNSHLLCATVPNLRAYDPAYAYEIGVIVQDGMRRMYREQEDVFYYITLYNENYPQVPMPEGVEEGILKGMYKLRAAENIEGRPRIHLFGSGTILRETLRAQKLLDELFGVAADVWSVTSYKALRSDALAAERDNRLHPLRKPKRPYVAEVLADEPWPIVAASDYVSLVPDMIRPWAPAGMTTLGTDGFGRSDSREALRRFFEVDAENIALAALHRLMLADVLKPSIVAKAVKDLGLDADKPNQTMM
jgi:pyruvate dehydrogenase E1 component